jgi:hypothetical protein
MVAAEPCDRALDDPALGQDDEIVSIAAFDDLQCPAADIGDDSAPDCRAADNRPACAPEYVR